MSRSMIRSEEYWDKLVSESVFLSVLSEFVEVGSGCVLEFHRGQPFRYCVSGGSLLKGFYRFFGVEKVGGDEDLEERMFLSVDVMELLDLFDEDRYTNAQLLRYLGWKIRFEREKGTGDTVFLCIESPLP